MTKVQRKKMVRMLFDESHSNSWSISRRRAEEINPDYPENSSYQAAADVLGGRDFVLARNPDRPIDRQLLASCDILAIIHPTSAKWEKTTGAGREKYAPQEIKHIQDFVREGGSLLVITEYEHDKYGDNLNDLLAPFGLKIQSTTVIDKKNCLHTNPAWVLAERGGGPWSGAFAYGIDQACFYQAGSCQAEPPAQIVWQSAATASPARAGLMAVCAHGKGRVVLVTDSLLFGDEHLAELGQRQLWLNVCYWLSVPAFERSSVERTVSTTAESKEWLDLKATINRLRLLQKSDGTAEPAAHKEAAELVKQAIKGIEGLKPRFPRQSDYLKNVLHDLQAWAAGGFGKPDFAQSLATFHPEKDRKDGTEFLIVFPMYTPNASMDVRFEAMIIRTPWPDWLAELERTMYQNDKFAPAHLVDYTDGYQSECAVIFPETVSVVGAATNNFGDILCDREARRLQAYFHKAAPALKIEVHPELECFFASLSVMQDTYVLWDLIHDKSHAMGELPFDPFMIRQRAPYWMYALEELRVDLRSFGEALKLAQNGFPFARYVTYAILFDRILRFAISGSRVRNYDALGGQLLFSFLHQKEILVWSDNRLTVKWDLLAAGVARLAGELGALYRGGADSSKMNLWLDAHDLISRYVKPNVGSAWKKDSRAVNSEADVKKWLGLIQDDEFPLGSFHLQLQKKVLPISY